MTQPVMPQQQPPSMYYMNSAPSNQMTSYATTNQQMMMNADVVGYNGYMNRPPHDVITSSGHHQEDGWNGMWRQSSRQYREMNTPYQQPAVQQQMMYAAAAPVMQHVVTAPGPYSSW